MKGNALEERIVLATLQTLGRILLVFGGDITGHTRNTALFLLSAFEDNLNAIAFLCHVLLDDFLVNGLSGNSLAQSDCKTFLVDCFHTGSRHLQGDPATLFF